MARYDAATVTIQAELDNIDVVALAQQIIAYASVGSAFAPYVPSAMGPRRGLLARRDEMTWAALDLDSSTQTEPDEQAYAPTSRSYECAGNYADAVIGQEALADGRTSGQDVVTQIRLEGGRGYLKRYDALCAARYVEAPAGNTIGSQNDAMTAGLLNQAIRLLFDAGAEGRLALVAHSSKYEEIMAIPGMQERAIVGGRNGAIELSPLAPSSKTIVRGWNGVLDIALSDQIVSSTGYHNMVFATNPNTPGLVNKWHPLETPSGVQPGKMLVDPHWESARRAVEINMTTNEYVGGYLGSTTDNNDWMVDLITA